jgi:hypothetical protein
MKVKNIWSSILIILLIILTFVSYQFFGKNKVEEHTYILPDGYVPDENTAIKIAEAIWLPLYGKVIYDEKPFQVELKDSVIWIVQGTLVQGTPYNIRGGVAYIEIQKSDCKILKVGHGK